MRQNLKAGWALQRYADGRLVVVGIVAQASDLAPPGTPPGAVPAVSVVTCVEMPPVVGSRAHDELGATP
jgi:hypothetical protein